MNDETKASLPSKARHGAGKDAPSSPALDWVEPTGSVGRLYRELDVQLARRKRRRMALLGAAAGCAVLLLATTLVWRNASAVPRDSGPAPTSAIVSAPARQVLPDGSIVDLNGDATIRVEFSEALRRVVLSRGEAHFQVAKNPRRPFVVVAGSVEVRAVGTAFSVELGAKSVDVLVTEGRVAVDRLADRPASASGGPAAPATGPSATSAASPTLVDAGHFVAVDLAPDAPAPAVSAVQSITPMQSSARLAWRAPRVEFTMTPLGEAITVFEQHAGVKIHLADPEMAKLELSGVVRADNVDSLLRLLEAEFRIQADRRGNEILLRR